MQDKSSTALAPHKVMADILQETEIKTVQFSSQVEGMVWERFSVAVYPVVVVFGGDDDFYGASSLCLCIGGGYLGARVAEVPNSEQTLQLHIGLS